MNSLFTGLSYFLDGFELITKPGIKRFVVIPVLINIILFIGLFLVLRHFMQRFDVWFASFLPAWLAWLGILLWVIFFIAFCLIFIYTFVTIANLIGAPFNSLLAEKVEAYLTQTATPDVGFFATIKDMPRSIGRQLGVLAYYFPRACIILFLFFVPLVQTLAPFFWFLFNAWFMAMTYIDYPTDNHRVSLLQTREFLQRRRFTSFGFGISALIITGIPILNFFVMPAAVAGATKFWLQESKIRE